MSLDPSVAETAGLAGGMGAAPDAAMEKLDLTLEEIISTGDRREGSSRVGTSSSRHGRRQGAIAATAGRGYDGRNSGRRPGRAEALVNLKFAGSINKRRNPAAMAHVDHQTQQRQYHNSRNMLATKAFQQIPQLPPMNGAMLPMAPTPQYVPMQEVQWPGTMAIPHVLVSANSAPYALRLGNQPPHGKFGSKLGAQEAALLSTEVIQEDNGDLLVRFKQTDLIIVKAGTGDLILNSGGYRTFSTKAVLNQALQPVGLWVDESVTPPSNDTADSNTSPREGEAPNGTSQKPPVDWVVSDRRSYLATFTDGMVIRQAGALTKAQMIARGSVIAQHLRQRKVDAEQKSRHRAGS
eukprot:Blabericola_migrator_1__2204@NODE_1608_length_4174_cov_165_020940_g1047_i0_p2_GENE_NODE_1608_length_4174_cov_165_020940_g1047_i0NODE_1608_length_4174_cov_165_020940_g1047_i0_p2_ORF_typecomplete_len351_score50_09FYTT/PF07078_11/0_26_NODE_1608_length_4174_cov_165_020940_g1047_i03461398